MWWGRQHFMRVTHEPSGMTAEADFSPSWVKCRAACRSVLRGKLWSLEHGVDQPSPTKAQRDIAEYILRKHK